MRRRVDTFLECIIFPGQILDKAVLVLSGFQHVLQTALGIKVTLLPDQQALAPLVADVLTMAAAVDMRTELCRIEGRVAAVERANVEQPGLLDSKEKLVHHPLSTRRRFRSEVGCHPAHGAYDVRGTAGGDAFRFLVIREAATAETVAARKCAHGVGEGVEAHGALCGWVNE
jgi:hypothetical protein